MRCPFCGNENTKVVDSRVFSDGNSIKRRRECEKCEKRVEKGGVVVYNGFKW